METWLVWSVRDSLEFCCLKSALPDKPSSRSVNVVELENLPNSPLPRVTSWPHVTRSPHNGIVMKVSQTQTSPKLHSSNWADEVATPLPHSTFSQALGNYKTSRGSRSRRPLTNSLVGPTSNWPSLPSSSPMTNQSTTIKWLIYGLTW